MPAGRSPRGECGLKFGGLGRDSGGLGSLPSRGVWIEIHTRRAAQDDYESLPSRGVWIEIHIFRRDNLLIRVAPLAGSVD